MNSLYLEVNNLKTYFHTPEGVAKSVDGVSFNINKGETLALVGESGCGKTVTSLSLIRLLSENAKMTADSISIEGKDIKDASDEEIRKIRGRKISMIFQEPMTSLDPSYKIKKQIGEVYKTHFPHMTNKEIYLASIEMLKKTGVPNPEERINVYPHQLSGGLRQRVMIAISLAASPDLVIADEPTTALDVTIQAQIIELLKELQRETGMSILLITHDFGVVSQIAQRVAVMYAGKIIEEGPAKEVFHDPLHPYTRLLIMSIPGIKVKRGGRLEAIRGNVPNPLKFPEGCRFHTRCPEAMDICREKEPEETVIGNRRVCCFLRGGCYGK